MSNNQYGKLLVTNNFGNENLFSNDSNVNLLTFLKIVYGLKQIDYNSKALVYIFTDPSEI